MMTDCRRVIEYVNPAFEALSGYTGDEACGKSPRILRSGEQGPEVYQELFFGENHSRRQRLPRNSGQSHGELYYVEESIRPVRDGQGHITHFVGNGRDLTERLRLEAQLAQAQKMDAIGRLAGGVAHDFNNLLTIITSYSELDEVPANPSLTAKIQEILQAARRAAELTRGQSQTTNTPSL